MIMDDDKIVQLHRIWPLLSNGSANAESTPGGLIDAIQGSPEFGQTAAPPDIASPEFSKLGLDALFNIRQWVQSALEAKGAKCVGAGIGVGGTMGIADVQIEVEGCQYNIGITPLPR
jgi:hypothetical protein